MSREKSGDPKQPRPIWIPPWWLQALNRRVAELQITKTEVGIRLSRHLGLRAPISSQAVGDFLRGKVTTDRMMRGFCAMFPDLPPPVVWASSYEEADRLRSITNRKYQSDLPSHAPEGQNELTSTIEDTGQQRSSPSSKSEQRKRAK